VQTKSAEEVARDVLKQYRCQHQVDEDGNALPLVDALSPKDTIKEGLEEIEMLADDVAEAIDQARIEEREKLAAWMIAKGYTTGHGDTVEDLLAELDWQVKENDGNARISGIEIGLEAGAKALDEDSKKHSDGFARQITRANAEFIRSLKKDAKRLAEEAGGKHE